MASLIGRKPTQSVRTRIFAQTVLDTILTPEQSRLQNNPRAALAVPINIHCGQQRRTIVALFHVAPNDMTCLTWRWVNEDRLPLQSRFHTMTQWNVHMGALYETRGGLKVLLNHCVNIFLASLNADEHDPITFRLLQTFRLELDEGHTFEGNTFNCQILSSVLVTA